MAFNVSCLPLSYIESVLALLLKAELVCVTQLWFEVGRKRRAAPMKEVSHSQFICAEDVGFEDAGKYIWCAKLVSLLCQNRAVE